MYMGKLLKQTIHLLALFASLGQGEGDAGGATLSWRTARVGCYQRLGQHGYVSLLNKYGCTMSSTKLGSESPAVWSFLTRLTLKLDIP